MSRASGSEATAPSVLEAFPDGVIVVDESGLISLVNAAVERLFGYARGNLLGQPVEVLFPEPGRNAWKAEPSGSLAPRASGTPDASIELLARRKDGRVFPVEVGLSRVLDAGRPLTVGLVTDVTSRKQAENRLKTEFSVTQALAESATLQEAAPLVIEAICEALGWEVGELWGLDGAARVLRREGVWNKPGLDLAAFHAEGRDISFAPGAGLPGRVWQTGEPLWVADVSDKPWYTRRDAARRSGLHAVVAFPVRSDRGVTGVLTFLSHSIRQPDDGLLRVMADIGSRIGHYAELKRARDELERQSEVLHQADKLASLGTLVAGVVHEMNNPLGIISSRIELMLMDAEHQGLPAPIVEDLQVLYRHTQRMSRVAQSLLSFARQAPRETRPVDLNGVVEDTLLLARKSMANEGIRISTALERMLPPLVADGTALQQLLLNLLTNSREAMTGGGEIKIETRMAPSRPDWIQLIVADTGPGIPPQVLPRIFDPFYTTKPTGTGLGLPVSYGIVKDHRGTIDVQSTPGQGTRFTLSFPLLPASAGEV